MTTKYGGKSVLNVNVKYACTTQNNQNFVRSNGKKELINVHDKRKTDIVREFGKEIRNYVDVNVTYIDTNPNKSNHRNIKTKRLFSSKRKYKTTSQETSKTPSYSLQSYSEYINEISAYLKSISTSKTNSCSSTFTSIFPIQQSLSANTRISLFTWLIEVHSNFNLHTNTLYLAFHIIDQFLLHLPCELEDFQLLGITALYISCKYEEVYFPRINEFIYATAHTYTKQQMLQFEITILQTLNFDINYVSPLCFVELFNQQLQLDKKCMLTCQYVIEACYLDCKMLKYNAVVIAVCAVYMGLKLTTTVNADDDKDMNKTLWNVSGYDKYSHEVKTCIDDMCELLDNIDNVKYSAIQKKYSSEKYMDVAYHKGFA